MNHKLSALARRMNLTPEKIPAPAPESGLGAQIEQLIAQAVEERVSSALDERQQPAHIQRLLDRQFSKPSMPTDYRELPPVARTPAPKAVDMIFQRDELGRIALVDVGFMQWRVQRNEVGQIVRMVPADIAPMPPAIEPPFLAKARQYRNGEPR